MTWHMYELCITVEEDLFIHAFKVFGYKEGRALSTQKFCWKINMQLQLDFSYERLVE